MPTIKYLLCSILLLTLIQNLSAYPTFDQYISDFAKNYTTEQKNFRRPIYEERIKNFSDITQYTPGVNNKTDWTLEEINQLKNNNLPRPSEQQNPPLVGSSGKDLIRVAYPSSLDWRTSKAVTSVKDQGECGSCWAFSVAAYVQSKLIIQKQFPSTVDLSEQYLLSCTSGSSCDGGWPNDAMNLVAKSGIPYEASFPYVGTSTSNSNICSSKNTVKDVSTRMMFIQNASDDKIIELLQIGTLSTYISSDGWQNYGSGIFSCANGSKNNHAVLIVGYTSTHWIIKNQWGRQWGQNGYIRVNRDRSNIFRNCFVGSVLTYMRSAVAFSNRMLSLISLTLLLFAGLIF